MNVPQYHAGTHACMHTFSIPILEKNFVKQKRTRTGQIINFTSTGKIIGLYSNVLQIPKILGDSKYSMKSF